MAEEVEAHVLKQYNLVKKVGSGAYGHVWKVTDRKTGSTLALKKIFDAFQHSTDAQRTYRQIVFLHELDHPNIIKLFNVIRAENDKDLYLVFEYMQADLHNAIGQKILKDAHNRYILYQIMKGLKFMHSAQIIHRDLKPANLLLNSDCTLKICDFGLARSLNTESSSQKENVLTEQVATRWYRAPQVLLGSNYYDKSVDIWSTGCILAQILIGKPIFPGNTTLNQLQRILSFTGKPKPADIAALHSANATAMISQAVGGIKYKSIQEWFKPDVPKVAIDLVLSMLNFNPTKRPTSEQVLKHPYLATFHKPREEFTSSKAIKPPISDCTKLNVRQYRRLIYERIEKVYVIEGVRRSSTTGTGEQSNGSSVDKRDNRSASYHSYQQQMQKVVTPNRPKSYARPQNHSNNKQKNTSGGYHGNTKLMGAYQRKTPYSNQLLQQKQQQRNNSASHLHSQQLLQHQQQKQQNPNYCKNMVPPSSSYLSSTANDENEKSPQHTYTQKKQTYDSNSNPNQQPSTGTTPSPSQQSPSKSIIDGENSKSHYKCQEDSVFPNVRSSAQSKYSSASGTGSVPATKPSDINRNHRVDSYNSINGNKDQNRDHSTDYLNKSNSSNLVGSSYASPSYVGGGNRQQQYDKESIVNKAKQIRQQQLQRAAKQTVAGTKTGAGTSILPTTTTTNQQCQTINDITHKFRKYSPKRGSVSQPKSSSSAMMAQGQINKNEKQSTLMERNGRANSITNVNNSNNTSSISLYKYKNKLLADNSSTISTTNNNNNRLGVSSTTVNNGGSLPPYQQTQEQSLTPSPLQTTTSKQDYYTRYNSSSSMYSNKRGASGNYNDNGNEEDKNITTTNSTATNNLKQQQQLDNTASNMTVQNNNKKSSLKQILRAKRGNSPRGSTSQFQPSAGSAMTSAYQQYQQQQKQRQNPYSAYGPNTNNISTPNKYSHTINNSTYPLINGNGGGFYQAQKKKDSEMSTGSEYGVGTGSGTATGYIKSNDITKPNLNENSSHLSPSPTHHQHSRPPSHASTHQSKQSQQSQLSHQQAQTRSSAASEQSQSTLQSNQQLNKPGSSGHSQGQSHQQSQSSNGFISNNSINSNSNIAYGNSANGSSSVIGGGTTGGGYHQNNHQQNNKENSRLIRQQNHSADMAYNRNSSSNTYNGGGYGHSYNPLLSQQQQYNYQQHSYSMDKKQPSNTSTTAYHNYQNQLLQPRQANTPYQSNYMMNKGTTSTLAGNNSYLYSQPQHKGYPYPSATGAGLKGGYHSQYPQSQTQTQPQGLYQNYHHKENNNYRYY